MGLTDRSRVRILAVIAVVAIVGVGVPFVTRKQSEWDDVYRNAARRLLDDASLYPPSTNYVYPPLSSLLATPFVAMPDRVARVVWYAVNVACIGYLLARTWAFVTKQSIVREPVVFWIGLAIGFPFVLHTLAHQQIDIVIAALVVGGCSALARSQIVRAVVALGLAAAIKCTPLLFVPYLLLKGRPFTAAAIVLLAITTNLLPDLVSRPSDATCHLEKWYRHYISPMLSGQRAPGVWASDVLYNQSLIGAANRWTQTTWTINDGKVVTSIVPARIPSDELKRLQYGLFAGLGAVALAAMRHGRRAPNAFAWECGLVLMGMVLLSPMSSIPHFVTLLLPGWLLTEAAIRGRRELWPFVIVMVMGALLSNKDLVGGRMYTLGLWYGSVMLASVAAFAGCAVGLAYAPSEVMAVSRQHPNLQLEPRRAAA